MNENPYASPAEVPEEPGLSEEEKYVHGLRRLARGVVWISWSCVLMMALVSFLIMETNGFWISPGGEYEFTFFTCLTIATILGVPATQLMGMILCYFCPERLVRRGWLHVLGSVVMLGLAVLVPMLISFRMEEESSLLMNFQLVGVAASTVVWQIFLLRLAYGLRSTAGIWLAWGLIAVFCVLAVGGIVFFNINAYFTAAYRYNDPVSTAWFINRRRMDMLGEIAMLVCGGIYMVLLETLRRRMAER